MYQLLHVLNIDLYEVYTVFVNDRRSNTKGQNAEGGVKLMKKRMGLLKGGIFRSK